MKSHNLMSGLKNKSLDWHLLNSDSHKKFNNYVRDLNKLYLDEKCL